MNPHAEEIARLARTIENEMRISYAEFHTQLGGARLYDAFVWPELKCEEVVWDQWAFDDDGAHYINARNRRSIDRAEKRKLDSNARYDK